MNIRKLTSVLCLFILVLSVNSCHTTKETATKETQEEAIETKYNEFIKEGDEYFATEQWTKAKEAYVKAVQIKPSEEYPQTQIKKINAKFKPKNKSY